MNSDADKKDNSAIDSVGVGDIRGESARVFISYSREDSDFARRLLKKLEEDGFEAYLDTVDILPGEPWQERLGKLIASADTVVFVISPNSIASPICEWEIDESERLSKRILPVRFRKVSSTPERLQRLNWISFGEPTDDFSTSYRELAQSINRDIFWIREHTRIAELAAFWMSNGRMDADLLRGATLDKAEIWMSRRPSTAPDFTASQRLFVQESRAKERSRLDAERDQLARTRRFQKRAGWALAVVAILLACLLANILWQQRATAARETRIFTQLSLIALNEGYYERAARYALAAMPPRTPIANPIYPSSKEPGHLLARVETQTRLVTILREDRRAPTTLTYNPNGQQLLIGLTDGTVRLYDSEGKSSLILSGHAAGITDASFSRDGKLIATASNDRTARVWDSRTGNSLFTFTGNPCQPGTSHYWGCTLSKAVFSPDGHHLVTGSFHGEVLIWKLAEGVGPTSLIGHTDRVNAIIFEPIEGARLLTVSDDRTVRVWDYRKGTPIAVLRGHNHFIRAAAFSRDGTKIVTADMGGVVRIWDSVTGTSLPTPAEHTNAVLSLNFSPDGTRLLTASWDMTARIWDVKSNSEITTLRGHTDQIVSARFSPQGNFIATASKDKGVRLWDGATGAFVSELKGHEDNVEDIAFSPDGRFLASISRDSTTRIWRIKPPAEFSLLAGHQGQVRSAAYSSDGTRLLTGGWDGTARLWNTAEGELVRTFRNHQQPVYAVAINADSSRILTASQDGTAYLWDVVAQAHLAKLVHEGSIYDAAFSRDGAHVATASFDKTARLWNAQTGALVQTLKGHTDWLRSVRFSPDGKKVVTASRDGTAKIWEWSSGRDLFTLRGHQDEVWDADFSPDGNLVVTASLDGVARIWDLSNGQEIATLSGHAGRVWSAGFGKDGRIVTASADETARIWSADGKAVHVLRGHRAQLLKALFSSDGRLVLTISHDRTARLWDAATGSEVAAFLGHRDGLTNAAFSPLGNKFVTTSYDGTARIWNLLPALVSSDELRRDRSCERLATQGADQFTALEITDPILEGRSDLIAPCRRFGIFHPETYFSMAKRTWRKVHDLLGRQL